MRTNQTVEELREHTALLKAKNVSRQLSWASGEAYAAGAVDGASETMMHIYKRVYLDARSKYVEACEILAAYEMQLESEILNV